MPSCRPSLLRLPDQLHRFLGRLGEEMRAFEDHRQLRPCDLDAFDHAGDARHLRFQDGGEVLERRLVLLHRLLGLVGRRLQFRAHAVHDPAEEFLHRLGGGDELLVLSLDFDFRVMAACRERRAGFRTVRCSSAAPASVAHRRRDTPPPARAPAGARSSSRSVQRAAAGPRAR